MLRVRGQNHRCTHMGCVHVAVPITFDGNQLLSPLCSLTHFSREWLCSFCGAQKQQLAAAAAPSRYFISSRVKC